MESMWSFIAVSSTFSPSSVNGVHKAAQIPLSSFTISSPLKAFIMGLFRRIGPAGLMMCFVFGV
jgi:hypothetical protein